MGFRIEKDRITSEGGMVIVQDELLTGHEHGVYIDNIIVVSPSIMFLLQDEESRETVMEQVQIFSLKKAVEQTLDKMIAEKQLIEI
jgi:hypothetical protein